MTGKPILEHYNKQMILKLGDIQWFNKGTEEYYGLN